MGGHCSGKSGVIGEIKRIFKSNNKIEVLGRYKESKTNYGLLTGGMDGIKANNKERYEIIKNGFLSDKPVIICEGMMIIYYSSFISKYYELQKIKNRDVIIVLFESDLEIIKKRLYRRSNGKEFTEKRLKHIISKMNTSKSTFDKIITTDNYNKTYYKTNTDKEFDLIIKKLKEKIEEYLI